MMLQIKPRIRPSKIQKHSAICNYGGNCYFEIFSFFQGNSMLLAEILDILNHRKPFHSWWRLNIIGNQNNVLSTYFSWLKKKSSFWNCFKNNFTALKNHFTMWYWLITHYFFTDQNISFTYFKARGGGFFLRKWHLRYSLWYFSPCNHSFSSCCESVFAGKFWLTYINNTYNI